MTFFRPHGGWEGHPLLCLCTCLMVSLTVGSGILPMQCDERFGERCIPNREEATCKNVLTKEWAYCKEYEHFCCKDWSTDENFTRSPDRATMMLFQDDFQENSLLG